MGVSSRLRDIRPPLPAPTETDDEDVSGLDTDVATTVTTRTDKSSYEIPEDGSPVVIPTSKIFGKKEGGIAGHQREKSQTSLLIEFFEKAEPGDRRSKSSIRVKVHPGSKKRTASANDAIHINGIGKGRVSSQTRRISLGSSKNVEIGVAPTEAIERNFVESRRPPIGVDAPKHTDSEVSTTSRGLAFNPVDSSVSSMPGDSMIEGSEIRYSERSRSFDRNDEVTIKDNSYLREPEKERSRSRSKERIAQKVMEKLSQRGSLPVNSRKSSSQRNLGQDYDADYSRGSDVSNNPKLLGMVEDTIKRIILPEIQAVKEEQKGGRRSADPGRKGSLLDDGLVRRVSKSSSSPAISSKPEVVLNKDEDDPGTVLWRGDSERKMRKSSRGSSTEERPKSKKSNHSLRDAGAASLGAGILTASALRQHDSQGDVQERRKRRSKSRGSRSRSTGITETGDYLTKEEVPPMPMASNINDSEITRESIVSVGTEKASSRVSGDVSTPVREVSRGSLGDLRISPNSSRTPTRTPVSRGLGMSHENLGINSPKSSSQGMSTNERQDAYSRHVDYDGYGDSPTSQRKISSPVQSVSSLKKNFEDDGLLPRELRPRSAASRSSAGRSHKERSSQTSLGSGTSSPLARSAKKTLKDDHDAEQVADSPGTPINGDDVEDWYERQHRLNNEYRLSYDADSANRDSFVGATNRDSYQTNPFPQDEKRGTMFTEDSQLDQVASPTDEQDLRGIGANPEYVHTPYAAESAVASLMDQSTLSSGSPTKGSYSDRMGARLRELSKESPPMYQGSTLSQSMPSQDRWSAIKAHARSTPGSTSRDDLGQTESPRQSPSKSIERSFDGKAVLGTSGVPVADDPLPEIGHFDDSKSETTTNASIIEGPLGGDVTGKSTWPYTPEPPSPVQKDSSSTASRSRSGQSKNAGMMTAAAAGSVAFAAGSGAHHATVEDDFDDRKLTSDLGHRRQLSSRGATPPSPAAFRDEGYATDAQARSAGSLTPEAEQRQYSRRDVEEFNRVMGAQNVEDDDSFTEDVKRARHISGNSHGMSSPLYDSATGKGIERIQSKDIVALMDHLTVRDAQRNARDTEILVTLVRSTTEMRQSFDEMRRFIQDQDRMIMQNTDRSADNTTHRVLSGPRPPPSKASSTANVQSEEDIQRKRKNVLRRALEGLKGGKSENDLARVENMLQEILHNVSDLKHQGGPRDATNSYTNVGALDDVLDDYERLRNVPDSGYEPSGRADTLSSPSQSGHFTPRAEKQQFHSGYDGRRGSANRVSTVLEGDEDETEAYANIHPGYQVENTERMLTPTQEVYGRRGLSPIGTPPQKASTFNNAPDTLTPRSAEKQRKHQSNNSSIFGVPKISRWSKTTTSSAAPDPATLDSPNIAMRNQKAVSEASRSGSTLARYHEDNYQLQDDDRLRSTRSLVREQDVAETRSQRSPVSKLTRTPSPLIPSEVSYKSGDAYDYAQDGSPIQEDLDPELDDPKYQAVRNSLLLQHPQPRQGTTPRHQNTLESQAHQFDDTSGTNSDVSQRTVSDFDPALWGSSGTAGLAKHRLSQLEPLSPVSMNSPAGYGGSRGKADNAPLVPPQKPGVPPKVPYEEPEAEYEPILEPQYSNSGFSRGGYYSSPYGSGHLLEPIEEVRYSLETDSGHISPEPEIASAKAIDMRSPARKITGPRPMNRTSSTGQAKVVETTATGAVRRKPVGAY